MIHQPLNVLQTCFSASWGGLELQALEISKQLKSRTHRVWLACIHGSRLEEAGRSADINVVPLKIRGYIHPLIVAKLARLVRREGIDIIHCQHSKDIATIVPARRISGERCPIILSKRVGSYVQKKDLLHQFTYANIARVLAISEVIRKNVIETTPVPPERVITLHDAVDTEAFSPSRVSKHRIRREFGIDDETLVVGFVGRFSPGKGHEEFLEAASALNNKYGNIRFLVVGEASYGEQAYEQRIRSMSRALKLDGVLTFTGFRKDVPDLMAAFDIFAFPSHAEAFGVALIEAMALERPVVSTNCDGVLDIVVDGETGIYVNPRNAQQLADAIERLGADPELRLSMGRAGRRRVEEMFDQQKHITRIEEIYYELLELPSYLKPRQKENVERS
ncbi:MAG: glycosyltransferase family 4 protein [Bacteroidetes bacterium]|nr:glycosyltransferase family 4 protein [Bacteroidota bacterium]MCW5896914.1 glycosyltransferase family 4 protein [Bacteroidota bacterium]